MNFILFIWTVFLSKDQGTNKNEGDNGWRRRKHSAGNCSEIHKLFRNPHCIHSGYSVDNTLNYPAWCNVGKHTPRKVTGWAGMFRGNAEWPGSGASMPWLHGSCYPVKAKQAATHTVSPLPAHQEWQEETTEDIIGCLGVFFFSLTSIYNIYRSQDKT